MATPGTLTLIALLALGLAFTAVAVVGLYRLPDVYARAHATSKSETLGALLALTAGAVGFDGPSTTVKLAALALFLLVTSPTAAHAIVRSADDQGIEPWTRADEDREKSTPERPGHDSDRGERT
jgi:multicomponent Na+:H+ antiporter subunit G